MHWNVPPDALPGSAMFVLFWTAGLTTALLQLHGIHTLPQLHVIHTFLTLLQSSHTSFTFATTCSCSILTAVPILNASVGQCEKIIPCSLCLTSFFCHQQEKLVPPWLSFRVTKKLMCQSKVPTLAIKLARVILWRGCHGKVYVCRCSWPSSPANCRKNQLKNLLFSFFPQYWRSPHEFKPVWNGCINLIGQGCKRLRTSGKISIPL